MKRLILLLPLVICSCTTGERDLKGNWIEVLPLDMPYVQGVCIKDNGIAESIGMETLKYHGWEEHGNKLILNGESIGNGQTILFADTFDIISLKNDTLVLKDKGRITTYARCNGDVMKKNPSRQAYEGFEWKEISGAGLKLMAQRNDDIRLLVDPLLPGVVMVRNGDVAPHALIRIFRLKNKRIDDVIDILSSSADWDKSQTCRFEETASGRSGVRRYVMLPDGDYAEMIDSLKKQEPVPSTCNGWGTGNSGMRYFEIYDNAPDKAVFMEIGQDAPLFDENSIELCETETDSTSMDLLYTMEGELRIGHEVRAFTPSGSDREFWIVDKTGQLLEKYEKVTKGQKNGKPVKATLRLEYNGKWDDGFAAEYDGTYLIREVVELKAE